MAEAIEMGRVTVEAHAANLLDVMNARAGNLPQSEVRAVVIEEALVDTGATRLSMPLSLIEQLGLVEQRKAKTMTAGGISETRLFGAVRLEVNGRDCIIDVVELPEGCPVLIGQVPLELMDWVVDMRNQKLIGNPAHDGEWTQELYTRLEV